jgi:hypothetical protein
MERVYLDTRTVFFLLEVSSSRFYCTNVYGPHANESFTAEEKMEFLTVLVRAYANDELYHLSEDLLYGTMPACITNEYRCAFRQSYFATTVITLSAQLS